MAVPNRQLAYDYSAGMDQGGLAVLRRSANDPIAPGALWGWSAPIRRDYCCMCEGRADDGGHLYAWIDGQDGWIDEFEVGDTDIGGTTDEITAEVRMPWIKYGGNMISGQELDAEHVTPSGASTALVFVRSYSEDTYSLTPTATGALLTTDELMLLPQGARVPSRACYLKWTQASGGASTLRRITLKAKRLRRYR